MRAETSDAAAPGGARASLGSSILPLASPHQLAAARSCLSEASRSTGVRAATPGSLDCRLVWRCVPRAPVEAGHGAMLSAAPGWGRPEGARASAVLLRSPVLSASRE